MYLRTGLGAVETVLDPADIPQLTPTVPVSGDVEALISKVAIIPGLSQAFQAARNQGFMSPAAPKSPTASSSSPAWLAQNGMFVVGGAGLLVLLALMKGRR